MSTSGSADVQSFYQNKYKIDLIFGCLLSIFILFTPFNSLGDAFALLQGTLNKTIPETSPVLKAYKDVFLFLSLVLAFAKYRKVPVGPVIYVGMGTLFVAFIFFIYTALEDFDVAVLGLRSYSSLLFFYIGYVFYKIDDKFIDRPLSVVLVIEACFQVYEMLYAPNFYGNQIFGVNMRNPGTFTSAGVMAAFSLYCLFRYYGRHHLLTIVALISVIMSHSSTAYLAIIGFGIYFYFKHRLKIPKSIILLQISVLSVISIPVIPIITFRDDVFVSFLPRIAIFEGYLSHYLGVGFGLGTSAALLFGNADAVIPDSFLAANLVNMGYLGLALSILCYISLFGFIGKSARADFLIICLAALSFTLVILEITPFIQLAMLFLGGLYRETCLNNVLQGGRK